MHRGAAAEGGFGLRHDEGRTAHALNGAGQATGLFGHSDGGFIALLRAARPAVQIAGTVVVAPHGMVEDLSVAGIEAARRVCLEGHLWQRLARYHAGPAAALRQPPM